MSLNKEISRRDMLILLGGAGAGAAIALATDQSFSESTDDNSRDFLFTSEAEVIGGYVFQREPVLQEWDGQFSFQHLRNIVESAKLPNEMNPEDRAEAVFNSVRSIHLNGDFIGTAFEIDESGYFVSVSHLVDTITRAKEQNPNDDVDVHIVNNYTSTGFKYKNAVRTYNSDAAILYAPTGKPRYLTEGVRLSSNIPEDDEQLWAYTHFRGLQAQVLSGRVDWGALTSQTWHTTEGAMIPVRRMVPARGMSGSPIVNRHGYVVAIQSAFLIPSQDQIWRFNSVGSMATWVGDVDQIIENTRGNG